MRARSSLLVAALAPMLLLSLATPARPAVVFEEDFSDNSAGWTLGPEWQIGPTLVSPAPAYGNPDPATDHTPSSDNGVAGMIIGGNMTTAVHALYYLESPFVNISSTGTAILSFWRWLNSDYPPFADNTVEVFNGSTWVVLWQSGPSPGTTDAAWTQQTFDVTAYRSANFRVRFGHSVGNGGGYSTSGWNVDDVAIFDGCADGDGDGYGSTACGGPDCDDANPAVNPAAVEVCNGVDDNCNGYVDEGVSYTYYLDADGDGWGVTAPAVIVCTPTPPPGHVDQPGDCDDTNAAINPAAVDLCDGIDNNCNFVADDSTAYWYTDVDGDGWGGFDPEPVLSCTPVPGRGRNPGDCDDTNATIYPNAPELLDGLDNNCNGYVDEGFEAQIIRSIRDVPNDQGRAVRIRWRRHLFDQAGSSAPIVSYSVYRQVVPGQSTRAGAARVAGALALPPGEWDALATVTATRDTAYQTVVATLCDSNSTAFCRSTFLVRAHLSTPGQYFDSAPDSGWSVDNIVPGVPAGLSANAVAGSVDLSWSASAAPDFQYFRVYRGATAGFAPAQGNLVHSTAATAWTDASPGTGSVYYKVTALDANGNESQPASTVATVGVGAGFRPTTLAFAGIAPNPFANSVSVSFDIPQPSRVTLAIHDVTGRRIRMLVAGSLEPGRHTRVWDASDDRGRAAPPGIYLLRLEAGGRVLTRRIVFVP